MAKKTSKPGPVAPALIDGRVSLDQCKRAVDALHKHFEQHRKAEDETNLLPAKEQHVWLSITVKKISSVHRFKPVKIPIVHPIVDPRVEAVCLITKDPQRKYKDLLEEQGIKFISRVVGIEKLKGKFKPFEARRQLLKQSGLFLADDRVIPLLPKLLGVKWFEAKKQPIPVSLTRKDLKTELERAISSTYMNQNQGTCTSVKIAKLPTHTAAQTLANLTAALPAAVNGVKGGWENVQSLVLKTNSSVGLPIWSCDLGENRWAGMEEVQSDEELEEHSSPKGKKRAAVLDEEDHSKPRKKKAKRDLVEITPSASVPAPITVSASTKTAQDTPKVNDSPLPTMKKAKRTSAVDNLPRPLKEKTELPKEESKKSREKNKRVDIDEQVVSASPTVVELKQKRAGKVGERKKEVVALGKDVKKKFGKGVKDALIGRKAGQ
ncbi:hypothetical protein HMN09_00534100 [Mycena chlorophos]|uniref:Ribosomal L1 domain-containing protein 1 n=1 Tax=Mycena chlorophos TaxID=658473 RepID=A0A8H6TA70_MYCCL|nr:hypothetical protein HMN09_00534100 [Mycena chlorophos]